MSATTAPLASTSDVGASAPTKLARVHLWAFVLIGALVPLGEGLSLGAMGVFLGFTLLRYREVAWRALADLQHRDVLLSFALWLGAGVLAYVVGGEGWLKPGEVGRLTPILLVPFAIASAPLLGEKRLRQAGLAFVVFLTVASLFALFQYVFNVRPGENLWRSSMATQSRIPGRYDETVAGGFYFHRLKMAHVLVVGVGVMFARQLFAELSLRRRAIELAILVAFSATAVLTYTRGALLAMAVAACACLPFASKRWRLLAAGGLVLGAAILLSVPSLRERMTSIGSEDASDVRALIWAQGARIISDHPFGAGLANYPVVVSRYYDTSDPAFSVRTYPHNVFLGAWAEAGPLGLLGYSLGFALLLLLATRHLHKTPNSDLRAAFGGLLFGTVGMLVIGLTHDVFFHNCVAVAYFGMVAAVLAFGSTRAQA